MAGGGAIMTAGAGMTAGRAGIMTAGGTMTISGTGGAVEAGTWVGIAILRFWPFGTKLFRIKPVIPAMRTKLLTSGLLGGVILLGVGCTIPSKTAVVPTSQANQMSVADVGTVVKVTEMAIEGRRTHVGQGGGAIIASAAASPPGGVRSVGGALGVAGATIAGAIIGEAVEEYATRKRAQEITVQMKNGDMVVIVQAAPPYYAVGDKVNVIHSPGGARVAMAMDY